MGSPHALFTKGNRSKTSRSFIVLRAGLQPWRSRASLRSPAHLVMTCLDLIASGPGKLRRPAGCRQLSVHQLSGGTGGTGHDRDLRECPARDRLRIRIPDEEITVTPLGVHADQFQIEAIQGDGGRGSACRAQPFLSVATDFPHKNVHNLLVAYGEFRSLWRGHLEPPALVLIGNKTMPRLGAYDRVVSECPAGVVYLRQRLPGGSWPPLYQRPCSGLPLGLRGIRSPTSRSDVPRNSGDLATDRLHPRSRRGCHSLPRRDGRRRAI